MTLEGVLLAMDQCTRWLASGVVFVLAIKTASIDEVRVPFYILGSILTAFLGKALKKVLAVQRPEGARQGTYGMPSSHANCSSYLVTAASVGVWYHYDQPVFPTGSPHDVSSVYTLEQNCWTFLLSHPIPVALEFACLAVCCLRWYGGSHTVPQLVAGFALGKLCLLFVLRVDVVLFPLLAELNLAPPSPGQNSVNDGINSYLTPHQKTALFLVYFLCCCAFAGRYVRKWIRGEEEGQGKKD